MIMDVRFENQKIEELTQRAQKQLRELNVTVMQLTAAFGLEMKEPPTAGADGGEDGHFEAVVKTCEM